MKNIFDYATKELTQDAFLMWLLDSYEDDDSNIRDISRKFVNFLLGKKINNVKWIWVKPQWKKIDVTCHIQCNNVKHLIYIEDKTDSYEHNQLDTYNKEIDKMILHENNFEVHKLYYKTDFLSEDERERVEDISKWKVIEFVDIYNFWKEYVNNSNLIVSSYAKHVVERYLDATNIELPLDDDKRKWGAFFKNYIIPNIKDTCDPWVSITRFSYSCLQLRPLCMENDLIPFFEIRSNDCSKGTFTFRILLYDDRYQEKYVSLCKEIADKFNKNGEFKIDYNLKQQVLHLKNKMPFKTKEELLLLLILYIDKYNSIIDEWIKAL